jgi:hypothetical protein
MLRDSLNGIKFFPISLLPACHFVVITARKLQHFVRHHSPETMFADAREHDPPIVAVPASNPAFWDHLIRDGSPVYKTSCARFID